MPKYLVDEIWPLVMGVLVCAGCLSASLSLGSRALLRGKTGVGLAVALPQQFPIFRPLVLRPWQPALGYAGSAQLGKLKSGVEKPTLRSVCEHGSTVRHMPCSTSAKGWWVIDALRCIQKYLALYQLDHFQGLRCRVYICRPAHSSFSPGRTAG